MTTKANAKPTFRMCAVIVVLQCSEFCWRRILNQRPQHLVIRFPCAEDGDLLDLPHFVEPHHAAHSGGHERYSSVKRQSDLNLKSVYEPCRWRVRSPLGWMTRMKWS
jgi:hypothetical protein